MTEEEILEKVSKYNISLTETEYHGVCLQDFLDLKISKEQARDLLGDLTWEKSDLSHLEDDFELFLEQSGYDFEIVAKRTKQKPKEQLLSEIKEEEEKDRLRLERVNLLRRAAARDVSNNELELLKTLAKKYGKKIV